MPCTAKVCRQLKYPSFAVNCISPVFYICSNKRSISPKKKHFIYGIIKFHLKILITSDKCCSRLNAHTVGFLILTSPLAAKSMLIYIYFDLYCITNLYIFNSGSNFFFYSNYRSKNLFILHTYYLIKTILLHKKMFR